MVQEREKKETGEETKKEKGGQVEEEKDKEVVEDVTDWVEVRRKSQRRTVEETRKDNDGKKRTVQIFVAIGGSRTVVMDVAQNDKVSDMKLIPNGGDMYATSGGKVLRRSDKLRSCGVSDRCTIQVTSRMRGGGTHKDKKSRAEEKQVTSEEPVSNNGSAILVSEKDRVIQSIEEVEREQTDSERKSQGKGDQRSGKQEDRGGRKGIDEEKEKGKFDAKVFQGNESDEEKVDGTRWVRSKNVGNTTNPLGFLTERYELTDATNLDVRDSPGG